MNQTNKSNFLKSKPVSSHSKAPSDKSIHTSKEKIIQGENPNLPETEAPIQNVPQSQKIPNIRGEKTLVCWNCLTVLMVKDEWSVVRCTNCDKINRVPGTEDNIDSMIRLNDNMNHFDLYVPYVYAIITCPFCQHENKVRKDAEHIVCFQCHNSFNVLSDNKWVKPPVDPNTQYPDPSMFQPPKIEKGDHSCQETQRLLKKLIKQLGKPKPQIIPPNDKYTVLRQLVRDVDEIDERRFNKIGPSLLKRGMLPGGVLPREFIIPREKIERDNEAKNNTSFINNKYLNDGMGLPADSEMEALKKKLYNEIKNDPKYRKKYNVHQNMNIPRKIQNIKPPMSEITNNEMIMSKTGNSKSDAVYKTMFTPTPKKDPNYQNVKQSVNNLAKIYGGLEFNF